MVTLYPFRVFTGCGLANRSDPIGGEAYGSVIRVTPSMTRPVTWPKTVETMFESRGCFAILMGLQGVANVAQDKQKQKKAKLNSVSISMGT